MLVDIEVPTTTAATVTVKFPLENGTPLRLPDNGMTRDQFFAFCQSNDQLTIERNAKHQIIIMPPTGSETGAYNAELTTELTIWNRLSKLGLVFDSSTGFTLSNGAERAPDTAWIQKARWEALPKQEKKKFARIVPDFILELRSEDQSLSQLREKIEEFMECGCRLAWLIDPQNRRTYVYSENGEIQTISFDDTLTGQDVMPGLALRLAEII
jgi:Uma2 family endonuclease